jgi:hypothetical protein
MRFGTTRSSERLVSLRTIGISYFRILPALIFARTLSSGTDTACTWGGET